jgi:glycosyltransferase involved in cell wall biosynthesis
MKGSDLLDQAAKVGGFEVLYSTDLNADLLSAAVFVYITRSEGLGSAALRAMAAGVPVVASRVGGLPEIVEHDKTGILTDNDPQAIAAGIRQALDRRIELGRNGRLAVEQRFSTEHMVQGTREAYVQVLG